MDRSILKLLLYLSPFILAAVLGLVAGVISLWEKSGPGRRKQALNQKLRNKDRDEAIKRLDQQNKKDRNVLIQIVKDKKDETYIREQALKRLSYVKNRDVFRDLAQDGFSNAILQLDEEQDQDRVRPTDHGSPTCSWPPPLPGRRGTAGCTAARC